MIVSKAVRTAYYSALNGNIALDGNEVPVFDVYAVPEEVTMPYILLSTQVDVQQVIKNCKRWNASILVDIVTGSTDPIGRSDAEDIAEQVEDIINPDTFEDLDLAAYGYQLGNTIKENDTELTLKTSTQYVYRKLLRYGFLITKL